MKNKFKSLLLVCALTIASSGFAQPDSTQPSRPSNESTDCNPAIAALIGGIFGALIGEKNRTRGAAVGAGIAALACAGINAMSNQTKDQALVEADYLQKASQFPVEPSVTLYRTSVTPTGLKLTGGQKLTTVSEIEVVRGLNLPVNEIKEQIILFAADGKEIKQFAKVVNEDGPGSGRFLNKFEFTFPQGVPQGTYLLQLALFVNGKMVQKQDAAIQVAQAQSTIASIAVSASSK